MKEASKKILGNVDLFHVPASLKASSKSVINSTSSGVVSVLLFAVFGYYFITNMIEVIKYERI